MATPKKATTKEPKTAAKAADKPKSSTKAVKKEETAPAKDVAGGAPTDDKQTEQAEIEANAKEIAAYAKAYAGNDSEGMF